MNSGGLSVDIPDAELKWTLKRVAVAERMTLRDLLTRILATWLREHGYATRSGDEPSATHSERGS